MSDAILASTFCELYVIVLELVTGDIGFFKKRFEPFVDERLYLMVRFGCILVRCGWY